jgi:hypothetical protein
MDFIFFSFSSFFGAGWPFLTFLQTSAMVAMDAAMPTTRAERSEVRAKKARRMAFFMFFLNIVKKDSRNYY